MRDFRHLLIVSAGLVVTACASTSATSSQSSSGATGHAAESAATRPAGENVAGAVHANLAGKRCQGAVCTCRSKTGDQAETPPPDGGKDGHKRFEIRIGAGGGAATLSSPTLGDFTS